MKLTTIDCERARPAGSVKKLSDGGGLQLWVQAPRGKYWRFAYKFGGKQKVLAIGPYPAVTLDQARQAALTARGQVAEGKDPAEMKKAEKQAIAARAITFRDVAGEYVARLRKEGRASSTISKNEWLQGSPARSSPEGPTRGRNRICPRSRNRRNPRTLIILINGRKREGVPIGTPSR